MNLWVKISIGVILVLTIGLVFAASYFYNYAIVPAPKDFIGEDTPGTTKTAEETATQTWFKAKENRTHWTIESDDQLKLSAIYLPAAKPSNQTVIAAHGYMGDAETMATYAKIFHDLGYNVLLPDARGHGKSEGNYIGFGWPERKDYVKWINKVLETNGKQEEIALYGISMGGATVMMTSGEQLPKNVKAIIEDCGYSSVDEELSYQLADMFNLPAFPLIPATSLMTKVRAGYSFNEASAVKQLKKNQTPMLFIHGDEDTFVPFEMLNEVYEATNVPKEKYIVKGAEHAKAYAVDPEKYQQVVKDFLVKYF